MKGRIASAPGGLVVGIALVLAGCAAPPQCGTYSGPRGHLGHPTLEVRRDGTLIDFYGIADRGVWWPVSDDLIEGDLRLWGGGAQHRFYHLNRATHTFEWASDLDTLRRRIEIQTVAATRPSD